MGRLEEIAKDKGFNSLRDLAFKVGAAAPDKKPDYIANKVRELDKGKDLAWWQGTGSACWAKMADILGYRESELFREIQAAGGEAADFEARGAWPFGMFPGLRPLNLKVDPLFPGVPADLVRLGGPTALRTWWVAPPGAGKTVVGRRLEVKFGWSVLAATSWSDLMAQLPESGRVYAELESVHDVPTDPAKDVPDTVRLCVAALAPPPEAPSPGRRSWRDRTVTLGEDGQPIVKVPPGPWTVLVTPPIADWAAPFVDWVLSRLPHPERFRPDEVRTLLLDDGFSSLLKTPGEVLDLCGVIDTAGVIPDVEDADQSSEYIRWAKTWLEATIDRDDRRVPKGMESHLRLRGIEVLVEMTVERLRRGLNECLAVEQWAELAPAGRAQGTDLMRIYELAESDDPDALEAIRRTLRPDGSAWVAAFEATRMLRPQDSGLVVQPAWLAGVVRWVAYERLFGGGTDALGALLLHEPTAELTTRRLIQAVSDRSFLHQISTGIEQLDLKKPEHLAWLDGVVRAVGIATGSDAPTFPVPPEVAALVWDRVADTLEQRWPNWPALPVLGVKGRRDGAGPTSVGAWFGAMLSISHYLDANSIRRPVSALNPWGDPLIASEFEGLVEALAQVGYSGRPTQDHPEPDDLLELAISRLGQHSVEALGVIRRHGRIIDIQIPFLAVHLSRGADLRLSDEELAQILRLECGLDAIRKACAWSDADPSNVLAWCWRWWSPTHVEAGGVRRWPQHDWPPIRWLGGQVGTQINADAEEVWRALPVEAVTDELCTRFEHLPSIWQQLSDPVWERWYEWFAAHGTSMGPAGQVFAVAPEYLVFRALRDGSLDSGGLEARQFLWQRMSSALLGLLDEMVREVPVPNPKLPGKPSSFEHLFWSAPDELVPVLLERVSTWMNESDQYPGAGPWIWRWLLTVVEGRKGDWRAAFALLSARRQQHGAIVLD